MNKTIGTHTHMLRFEKLINDEKLYFVFVLMKLVIEG